VLTISALPYLIQVANTGLNEALRQNPGLAKGVYLYQGHFTNELAASAVGLPFEPLSKLLTT
jgi:alanine dehydrogenase